MTSRRWLLAGLAIVAALLLAGRLLSGWYVDYQWYAVQGAGALWRARAFDLVLLRAGAFGVAFLFAFANLFAVRHSVRSLRLPRRIGNLEFSEEVSARILNNAVLILAVVLGVALAAPHSDWTSVELIRSGQPFGETDPYFRLDLGTWLYRLPLEATLHVWALVALVVVTLLVVFLYALTPSLRWENGRPVYLLLASAAAALLFATKETTFITLGTMLIACLCIWIWRPIRTGASFERNTTPILFGAHVVVALAALFYRREVVDAGQWVYEYFLVTNRPPETLLFAAVIALGAAAVAAWAIFMTELGRPAEPSFTEPVELGWTRFRRSMGGGTDLLLGIVMVVAVFIYLGALFFSSFFTYSEGVSKAFEAYAIWTKTGGKEHTQSGYAGYLKWLTKVESPLLILSSLGILVAMLRAKHRFAMFAALWALGLFIAYTLIPYKTPWLALSFTLPMCLVAGYGLGELLAAKRKELKLLAAAMILVGTSILAYQTYQLNFVRYDDEEMTYVYAHTKRGFLGLIEQIDKYAEKSGRGKLATIEIISPDYWPMTWYVNDYKYANFQSAPVDVTTSEMIVAKKGDQDTVVAQKYSSHYRFVGVWPLRPGVDLMLLVRRDLAGPEGEELYKIRDWVPPNGSQ